MATAQLQVDTMATKPSQTLHNKHAKSAAMEAIEDIVYGSVGELQTIGLIYILLILE